MATEIMSWRIITIIHILALIVLAAACGPNRRIMESAKPSSTPPPASKPAPMSDLERDLNSMRTADFNFIHIFRRKDGAAFDADDKKFLIANTPAEINRRVISDGGRALITGSNFRFPEENFKQLTKRFAFENFSKAGMDPEKPSNSASQ